MFIFAPLVSFAQNQFNGQYIENFINTIQDIVESLIPLLVTLAVVFFFWELVMFIKARGKGEEKEAQAARMKLVWALVAIFVMLSFMGLVRILQGLTGVDSGGSIDNTDIPQLNF